MKTGDNKGSVIALVSLAVLMRTPNIFSVPLTGGGMMTTATRRIRTTDRSQQIDQVETWLRLFIESGQVTELRALEYSTGSYRRPHTRGGAVGVARKSRGIGSTDGKNKHLGFDAARS